MFDQINGMPLHPLIIHAAVLGIPLAFLLTALFAFPRTRAWARWPLAVTVLGATAATFAAKQSGEALKARMTFPAGNPVANLIERHEALADQLFYIMLGYSVVTVATVFLVTPRVAVPGDPASVKRSSRGPLGVVLLVLLLVIGAVAFIWVARVGDIGARAVWNPNSSGLFPF
jgi:glucan phosphoethanolaminetransferase (alkaline phosphatase superfamily)